MKSKRVFLMIAVISVLFLNHDAFSQHPDQDQEFRNSSGAIVRIKDEMQHLKQGYLKLDQETNKTAYDYDEIIKVLDQMQGNVRMIQKINGDTKLNQPFKTLMKDIQSFQKIAKKKDPSQIENSLNGLYENCFRCHLTHSAARANGRAYQ